jgi:phosphatidylserine/phosphatidylglycerophosphate/cardiolipin synthase-like enzyme
MRKYFRPAVIGFILSLFLSGYSNTQAIDVPLNATAHVYFSPKGDATEAVVSEIDNTKSEILIQSYSFTNKEIAKALVNAHKKGVHIGININSILRNMLGGNYG